MNANLLKRVGEALYGERWQSDLARDLRVTIRTMQRWAAGSHPIAPGVRDDLRTLVRARGGKIDALLKALD